METSGEAGKVNISDSTLMLVKDKFFANTAEKYLLKTKER
jgi:hypothetical protein